MSKKSKRAIPIVPLVPVVGPCRCNEHGGTKDERLGRCYEMSARFAVEHEIATDQPITLVHGMIHAPVEDIGAVPYPDLPHAWCEFEEFGIEWVWEPVHGRKLPKIIWDRRYRAERHHTYTVEQALTKMNATGLYGPKGWEEGA